MKRNFILMSSFVIACSGPLEPEASSGSGGSAAGGSDTGQSASSGGTGGASTASASGGAGALSTGGTLSTGGAALDSDRASGGVSSAAGGGGSDPAREALISAVTNFCWTECDALADLDPCSDGNVKNVPDIGFGCSGNCQRSYFNSRMECSVDLTIFFNCLLDHPGYFEVHCEGTELVRADTTHCLDELAIINSCFHPEM